MQKEIMEFMQYYDECAEKEYSMLLNRKFFAKILQSNEPESFFSIGYCDKYKRFTLTFEYSTYTKNLKTQKKKTHYCGNYIEPVQILKAKLVQLFDSYKHQPF